MSDIQTILITGCSSGFGLLTAARLASRGHNVIATMRNLDKAGELLSEVNHRQGQVDLYALDVTNRKQVDDLFDELADKYDYIDAVVNNAGYGIGGFFEDLTEEEIRAQMDTNFFGLQNVTRAAIPCMRPHKSGKIINISSVAGLSASPCFSAYNSSKWAVEGFSESLYYELKPFGINVTCVEPGTYRTKIFHENGKYAKNYDNPNSPYFQRSQFLRKKVMDYVNNCKKDPEKVAEVVENIINMKNPPMRYIVDVENRMLHLLRRILPFKLYSKIIEIALFSGFSD